MIGIGIGLPLTPVMGSMRSRYGNRPAMELNMLGGALDSRITFARADAVTCATYFDSTGRLQRMGRNVLLWSSDFSNASWSKTDVTPSAGGSSPLDTAWLLTEGSAGTAYLTSSVGTVTAGSTITGSIVLKRGSTDWVFLRLTETSAFTDRALAYFNLSTGAKGTVTAFGAATATSSTITSLGGGWYRCTVTVLPNGTYTTCALSIASATADGNSTRVSGATYYASAAQLEVGSTATSYSATTTAATSGPRFDYDPATAAGVTGGNLWSAATLFSAGTVMASGPDVVFSGAAALVSAGQAIPSGNGKTFTVTFTITDYVSGDARFILYGSGAQLVGVTRSAAGTYTETVRLTTAGGSFTDQVRIQTVNGATLRVTGLSIREVAFTPRGLLIEESRANLLLQSRDMTQAAWSKTDVTPARTQVGLDGVANTACLMTEGSAGTAQTVQSPVAVTAGATLTGSIVLKRSNTDWVRVVVADSSGTDGANAWFNLNTGAKGSVTARGAGTSNSSTITSLGGGWYRCTLTTLPNGVYTAGQMFLCSASADNFSTRVSGATYIVDCAQLEVGAFATSIIPTTTTALTRAVDSASMTGTNFSSWWNQAAGTFVLDHIPVYGSGIPTVLNINEGNARIKLMMQSTSTYWVEVYDDSLVAQVGASVSMVNNAINKVALAVADNNVGWSVNGAAAVVDTSCVMPTPITLTLGGGAGGSNYVRRLTYYPRRLSNAELQSITA